MSYVKILKRIEREEVHSYLEHKNVVVSILGGERFYIECPVLVYNFLVDVIAFPCFKAERGITLLIAYTFSYKRRKQYLDLIWEEYETFPLSNIEMIRGILRVNFDFTYPLYVPLYITAKACHNFMNYIRHFDIIFIPINDKLSLSNFKRGNYSLHDIKSMYVKIIRYLEDEIERDKLVRKRIGEIERRIREVAESYFKMYNFDLTDNITRNHRFVHIYKKSGKISCILSLYYAILDKLCNRKRIVGRRIADDKILVKFVNDLKPYIDEYLECLRSVIPLYKSDRVRKYHEMFVNALKEMNLGGE